MWSARGLKAPIGFGLLFLLVSAGLFATVPSALARQHEYAAAPVCPSGTRPDPCRTEVPATVKGTEDEAHGRIAWSILVVVEQGTDTVRRIHMAGTEPVYQAARAGDEVTLTYWQGKIRTVRLGTASQATHEAPSEGWRLPVAFGFLAFGLGLVGLITGLLPPLENRDRSSASPGVPWKTVTGISASASLMCVGFTAAMMADDLWDTLLFTAVGFLTVVPLTALFTRREARRANRATGTGPVVP